MFLGNFNPWECDTSIGGTFNKGIIDPINEQLEILVFPLRPFYEYTNTYLI